MTTYDWIDQRLAVARSEAAVWERKATERRAALVACLDECPAMPEALRDEVRRMLGLDEAT